MQEKSKTEASRCYDQDLKAILVGAGMSTLERAAEKLGLGNITAAVAEDFSGII